MRSQIAAAIALLLSAGVLLADVVVTQKVEGGGQAGDVVIKIKGDKIRADLPQQVSSLTDTATGEVITLMHAQKSYLRISPERAKALMQKMQERVGGNGGTAPVVLTPANRKEKIGDWEAEVFTSKVGGLDITYWFVKDFPDYAKFAESIAKLHETSLGGLNKGLGPNPREFPGMPVKTEMNLGGKKITSTIVSVKEESVEPSVFEVPAAYKEMDLPPDLAQ
jgi:hypothetical protein